MKLVSLPANPVPEGAVTGMLKTPDGVNLRFARWQPPPGRKGTVCVFQGRAEFIEKYFEVVRDLRSRGFAVAMIDWRGQGLSDRALRDSRKGYVRDFAEYDIDLQTFVREVVLPDCPPPLFAIGHSMGGTILIRNAFQGRRWFDRMMLSAPMISLNASRFPRFAGPALQVMRLAGLGASYAPTGDSSVIALRPFAGNPLTSDPVRHARTKVVVETEPALGLGAPTVAWAYAAYETMSDFAAPTYPGKIRLPIVIVAAGRDEIVSTAAIEEFSIRLRAGSHLIVAGSRHEILMEQDRFRAQFWAAFDAFVPGTPVFG